LVGRANLQVGNGSNYHDGRDGQSRRSGIVTSIDDGRIWDISNGLDSKSTIVTSIRDGIFEVLSDGVLVDVTVSTDADGEFDPSIIPSVGSLDIDVESVDSEESSKSISDLFGSVIVSTPEVDVDYDADVGRVIKVTSISFPSWSASTSSLIVAVISSSIWAHGDVTGYWLVAVWSGESILACAVRWDSISGGSHTEGLGIHGELAVGIGLTTWLVAISSSEGIWASTSEVSRVGDVIFVGE